jgi:hypothetical protein
MTTDRTTKALLALIAIGFFLNVFVPLLQPTVVNAQSTSGVQTPQNGGLGAFLPLFLVTAGFGFVGHLLAKDKDRNVALWTVLGLIPILNVYCLSYFIGASNKRLEDKLDAIKAVQAGD